MENLSRTKYYHSNVLLYTTQQEVFISNHFDQLTSK
jgi:hypothetical protein